MAKTEKGHGNVVIVTFVIYVMAEIVLLNNL